VTAITSLPTPRCHTAEIERRSSRLRDQQAIIMTTKSKLSARRKLARSDNARAANI
jgi:hypothetical protein